MICLLENKYIVNSIDIVSINVTYLCYDNKNIWPWAYSICDL